MTRHNSHPLESLADESHYLALAQALCQPGALGGPRPLVANAQTALLLDTLDGQNCLTSCTTLQGCGSYVCSLHTACIAYAAEELAKVPSPALRACLGKLIRLFDVWLTKASIDRVLMPNNLLLSTNLYPENIWSEAELSAFIERCTQNYPQHAIVFRSLNEPCNGPLMHSLKRVGCNFVASRQVYITYPASQHFKPSRDFKADQRLLARQTRYRLCEHHELYEADYKRMAELYRQLYTDKYSRYNPVFTEEFIRSTHKSQSLSYIGLRNREGVLDGFSAFYDRGGVSTAPLVGYDTTLPQDYGLYRLLLAWCLKRGKDLGLVVHMSSGVPEFKKLRGAMPHIEYSAVYTRHLPFGLQKSLWTVLGCILNRVAVPVLRYYGL